MNEYSFNRKRIYANFERKNKWLGIIDYKTLCFVLGYAGIIILILFLAWFFFTVACMWYAYTQRKSRGENPFTGKKRSR